MSAAPLPEHICILSDRVQSTSLLSRLQQQGLRVRKSSKCAPVRRAHSHALFRLDNRVADLRRCHWARAAAFLTSHAIDDAQRCRTF
jgi:hypothetical protein